jgi:mxaK protein
MAMIETLLLNIGSPRRTRVAWRGLIAVALVAAAAGLSWALKARDNTVIGGEALQAKVLAGASADVRAAGQGDQQGDKQGDRRGDAQAEIENSAPALLFAQAHALAAADQVEPALVRYRALYGHPSLGGAARYNSANLLLRQALALRNDTANPDAAGQALPLIELAKQGYREVLRANPGQWDARYNFERAQRAQPDPDEIDAPIGEPRAQAERSPTTTRGVGGGLP